MSYGKRRIALGVLVACAVGPAGAADAGFYLGGDLGWAQSRGNVAWRTSPTTVLTGFGLDDQGLAWSLFAGYRVDRYLAFEAGYVDLGHLSTPVNDHSGVTQGQADLKYSVKGETVAAVATLPFGRWEPYLKLGYLFSNTRTTVTGTEGMAPLDDRVSTNTGHALGGIGLGYAVDSHWHAQFGLTGYFRAGGGIDSDGKRINGPNIRAWTAGASYRF